MLGLMCLSQAKEHNAVMPVRLEPAAPQVSPVRLKPTAPWSQVKHSTTELPCL